MADHFKRAETQNKRARNGEEINVVRKREGRFCEKTNGERLKEGSCMASSVTCQLTNGV